MRRKVENERYVEISMVPLEGKDIVMSLPGKRCYLSYEGYSKEEAMDLAEEILFTRGEIKLDLRSDKEKLGKPEIFNAEPEFRSLKKDNQTRDYLLCLAGNPNVFGGIFNKNE